MNLFDEVKPIACLDHGFVELVDVMGDDSAIVEAARVSVSGEGVRPVSGDRALIRYLMRHAHTTPFEMVVFKLRIKAPIFVARQVVRHRMASTNEVSARYSELPREFYVPAAADMQVQAGTNKQGRGDGLVEDAESWRAHIEGNAAGQMAFYDALLETGMARELARINLPLSTYTTWVWKIDLHNLLHFLRLRLDAHAQLEIRVYAEAIASLVRRVCPIAWEAFEDYRLGAMTLSAPEVKALQERLQGLRRGAPQEAPPVFPTSREAQEWTEKLAKLEGA